MPRLKNKFFIFPAIAVLINYPLLALSWHLQNNTNLYGGEAWGKAVFLSEISLILIVLSLIMRIIFSFQKKLNLSEFLIWWALNTSAFIYCLRVIGDRI